MAVIVDALTDNRNRTAPEVRHLLDKYGKGLGATGCVSWSFDRKGVIIIEKEDLDEDTVMMDALDAGADDMQVEEETFEVYTDPDAFGSVLAQHATNNAGVNIVGLVGNGSQSNIFELADGNADLTYTWTEDALDTTTYATSENGTEITNQLSCADPNLYEGVEKP